MGDGDLGLMEKFADPSISVYYPAFPRVIEGAAVYRKILEGFRSSFPDAAVQVEEEIAENDKAVIRWTFSGTHKGQFLGYPATDRNVRWTGITIFRIAGGKVAQERGEEDYLGFLRQSGIIAQP